LKILTLLIALFGVFFILLEVGCSTEPTYSFMDIGIASILIAFAFKYIIFPEKDYSTFEKSIEKVNNSLKDTEKKQYPAYSNTWTDASDVLFNQLIKKGITPLFYDYTEEMYPGSVFIFNGKGDSFTFILKDDALMSRIAAAHELRYIQININTKTPNGGYANKWLEANEKSFDFLLSEGINPVNINHIESRFFGHAFVINNKGSAFKLVPLDELHLTPHGAEIVLSNIEKD